MLDVETLLADLQSRLSESQFDAAAALVERAIVAIDGSTPRFDEKQRKVILGALRGKRRFELMAQVAQALIRAGHDDITDADYDPLVRRQYAQALIEIGQTGAARAMLEPHAAQLQALVDFRITQGHDAEALRKLKHEIGEALGLLGRTCKQDYVAAAGRAKGAAADVAPCPGSLQAALSHYARAADGRTPVEAHWPLINLIAMASRADRDHVARSFRDKIGDLAGELIKSLTPAAEVTLPPDRSGDQPWLRASLGEAYVAQRNWPMAIRWYSAYAAAPGIDAFELASTRRQLVEVWQIDPESPDGDGHLVRLLDFALASKAGGSMTMSKAARDQVASGDGLVTQAILDDKSRPYRLDWLRNGFDRARSVAGIFDEGRTDAHGTAFLIEGGKLHPSLGQELVALTAAHVVSPDGKLDAGEVVLKFAEIDGAQNEFEVESLFHSPQTELDFNVLRLKGKTSHLTASPVRPFEKESVPLGRPCSTIGHPDGGKLAVSLANSELIDLGYKRHDRRHHTFLRYTTGTRGGNSGGPVYDEFWNVIGVHRAGIHDAWLKRGVPRLAGKPGVHVANEGVALRSISEEFRQHCLNSPAAITVPPELTSKWQQLEAAILSLETPESTIATLFDEMEPADFPGAVAAPEVADGTAPEAAAGIIDQFWYGGFVALSKAYRVRRNQRYTKARAQQKDALSFLSEGDSWFQYPYPGIRDVIDHLSDSYPIQCRALAGAPFEDMFAETRDLLAAIREFGPDGILLSGGGNDLLGNGRIRAYVDGWLPEKPVGDLLLPTLDRKIEFIVTLFDKLVADALQAKPDLKFFLHGYDRAMPKLGGAWLNRPLKQLGYAKIGQQKPIVAALVDRFNEALAAFAARRPGVVHYVDVRGSVGSAADEWRDELHPRTAGFARVAAEFNRSIRKAFKDHPSIKRDIRNLGSADA